MKTVLDLFGQQVAEVPDKLAVSAHDGSLTYRELNDRADLLASLLLSKKHPREAVVGILSNPSLNMIVSILGILKSGGCYLPLDPVSPEERLQTLIRDAGIQSVVTSNEHADKLAGIRVELVFPAEPGPARSHPGEMLQENRVTEDQLAYVLYTSGSTGRPKGVMVEHRSLMTMLEGFSQIVPLDRDLRLLSVAPFTFDVSVLEFFCVLCFGGTLFLSPVKSLVEVRKFMEYLSENRISALYLPPAVIETFAGLVKTDAPLLSLKWLLLGVEPIRQGLLTEIQDSLPGLTIINAYGPTEATVICTYHHFRHAVNPDGRTPIGKALPGYTVLLTDEGFKPVSQGEEGQILIAGNALARGYLGDPDLTSARFKTLSVGDLPPRLYYLTGDFGICLENGEIEFSGRKDEQVKIRGFRIETGEIEAIVRQHPSIGSTAVIAAGTDREGKTLACFYTVDNDREVVDLREFLLGRLPDYMIPSWFGQVDEIPYTGHGKVDKKKLLQGYHSSVAPNETTASLSPAGSVLSRLYSEVLGNSSIPPDTPLIDLGGDSITAMILLLRIEEDMGIRIPLASFNRNSSINLLSRYIETNGQTLRSTLPTMPSAADKERLVPLSVSQQALWVIHELDTSGITHNMVIRIRVSGDIKTERLILAIQKTFGRFDIFRMGIVHNEKGVFMQAGTDTPPGIHITDLRGFPLHAREERVKEFVENAGRIPFRLSEPPLYRLDLLISDDNSALLYLTIHHLIFDGWSLGIIMSMMLKALNEDQEAEPVSENITGYAQYALWSHARLEQGYWDHQLAFWKERLSSIPLPMMMRHARKKYCKADEGSRFWWSLPADLYSQVASFAKQYSFTRFSVLLSAYGILLHKLSGRREILVGTAYADRTVPEFQGTPGYFTNMVALRIAPFEAKTGVEYVAQTGKETAEALSNAQYPFGNMIRELGFEKTRDHPSFFEAMFIMQNWSQYNYSSNGVTLEHTELGNRTAKTDLLFNVSESGKDCECWFEYPKALFTETEIAEICNSYTGILTRLITSPEKRLREITGHEPLANIAYLIGAGSLLVSCCDHLLENDWLIASVISGDDAVSSYCMKHHIPVVDVSEGIEILKNEQQRCWLFSVNNGNIIPEAVMRNEWITPVNYHNSLLPRYAGLHATEWALLNHETEHGISWHRITGMIDAGDLLCQRIIPVDQNDTAESLNLKCFDEALTGFRQITEDISHGTIRFSEQNLAERSYYSLYDRPGPACIIDLRMETDFLCRMSKAMTCLNTANEFGVPRFRLGEKWYILPNISPEEYGVLHEPGMVAESHSGKLKIAAGKGYVSIREVRSKYGRFLDPVQWGTMNGIVIATKLPLMETVDSDSLSLLNRRMIRNEPFWLARLKRHAPLKLPFVFTGSSSSQTIRNDSYSIPFAEFPELPGFSADNKQEFSETVVALVLLFISKLTDKVDFELPFGGSRNELLPISHFIPVSVHIDPDLDWESLCSTLIVQVNEQREKAPFYADIFYRYPVLKRIPEGESFFDNQIFVCDEESGDEPQEFSDNRLIFLINRSNACVEIRCSMVSPFSRPASYLAERLIMFAGNPGRNTFFRNTNLLTAGDLEVITCKLNDRKSATGAVASFPDMFNESVSKTPHAPAIRDGDRIITYRQLDFASGEVARMMIEKGFQPCETAGVLLDRSPMMIAAMIGIMKAGGAFLPMDPGFPAFRMEQVSQIAELRWIITSNLHKGSVPEGIAFSLIPGDDLFDLNISRERVALPVTGPDSPAYVIFTSGTTGNPKGVVIANRSMAAFIRASATHYQLVPGDRVLQFASVAFDTMIEEIFPALCAGACVALRSQEMLGSAVSFLQMVSKWEITVLDLPTAYWHELTMNMHTGKLALPACIRLVIIGGEKANPAIARIWGEMTGRYPELYNTYGPTETTVVATLHRFDPETDLEGLPIGRPIAGTTVWVAGKDLNPVLPFTPGELLIGGPQVALRLLGDKVDASRKFIRLTASAYPDLLFYRSGDLVWYDETGQLFHLGRNDTQVKIRGFRVDPGEVDRVLQGLEGITGTVTVPFGEENRKKLACYYTQKKERKIPLNQTRTHLAAHLPDYMRPAALIELDEFPMTLSRKIDLRALPPPGVELTTGENEHSLTDTEKKVATLFREVIPGVIPEPGSNFFALGGDSLDAVSLLSAISREFGYELPLRRFYELADLRAVTAEIETHWHAEVNLLDHTQLRYGLSASHISVLQATGSAPPLFIVYGDKANHFLPGILGNNQPLYTFLPQGSDGERISGTRVESMASLYLHEMVELYPDGPYNLAGFSFGGLVALEMALQLQAAGRPTGRVTLIDTAAPHLFRLIKHKVALSKKVRQWTGSVVITCCVISGKTIPPRYRNQYVLSSFRQAARTYTPSEKGLPVRFQLIRSARSVSDEPDLGWSQWKRFIPEIILIEGDHHSIVRNEQLVKQFASMLVDPHERNGIPG